MSTTQAPVRVAVVGCGAVARSHALALREHPGTILAAGVDPQTAARRLFTEAWDCPTFRSLPQAFAKAEFDAAVVCAPTGLHGALCEALLERGVDVLCEAPLARSGAEARALHGRARRLGRTLRVASTYRYQADLAVARRLVKEGALGRPLLIDVTLCQRLPVAASWRVDPALAGGGVWMDRGAHAIDILFEVLDAPIKGLSARFSPRCVCMEVEDTAEVRFQTECGTLARASLSWSFDGPDGTYLVVQGSRGTACVGSEGVRHRRHGAPVWTVTGRGADEAGARRRQLDAFLERRLRPAPIAIPRSVQALDLIERAYQAGRGILATS